MGVHRQSNLNRNLCIVNPLRIEGEHNGGDFCCVKVDIWQCTFRLFTEKAGVQRLEDLKKKEYNFLSVLVYDSRKILLRSVHACDNTAVSWKILE